MILGTTPRTAATPAFLATTLLAAALACIAPPARAGEPPALRHARICDTSACYYAWNVVDSDGDGVCDADEVSVGSDPYDPKSLPPLRYVVSLLGKGLLPSFEFGLAQVIVYPDKLQSTMEAGLDKDPLAAFPLGKRKEGLARLGLSSKQLIENGIDPEHDGITLALEHDSNTGVPARRVGGIDISLVSAGDEADAGSEEPVVNDVIDIHHDADGGTTYTLDNGDKLRDGGDGHGERTDSKNNVLDVWYVNPDADTGSGEPTKEQLAAWQRTVNATKRTAANQRPVGDLDPQTVVDKGDLIVLIDPEYSDFVGTVSGAPRTVKAQPEYHPGLPNPQENACVKCP